MSLLTGSIIKNSHILAGSCFIFLENPPGPNLKVYGYQISTLVERSEK